LLSTPARPEIDHRTIKLVVGVIALALPFLTWALAGHEITSISASYYETGPSQSQGRHRAIVYLSCAIVMALSILTIGGDVLSNGALSARLGSLLTFWGETLALVAFGISWLLASHVVPVLTRQEERFSPFRDANPP